MSDMAARIEAAVAEATKAGAAERSAWLHLQALIDEAQADINARNVSPIFAAGYDVMFERLRAVGK